MIRRLARILLFVVAGTVLGFLVCEWTVVQDEARDFRALIAEINTRHEQELKDQWNHVIASADEKLQAAGFKIEALEVHAGLLSSENERLKADIGKLKAELALHQLAPKGLRVFKNQHELRSWLEANPVSENISHLREYDCDDYAIDLARAAANDGYWVGLGANKYHMFAWAIVGNRLYHIEPVNDAASPWMGRWIKVD